MRKLIIAGHHRFVSHASMPGLIYYFGAQGRAYKYFMAQVCKGSKRKCKTTNKNCMICPVNWDCITLKNERIKLGWKDSE
jgi:hypothetical protein